MDRLPRRWLALVRALLVALGLSLLGTEPIVGVAPVAEVSAPQAHFHGVGVPDPDPIFAGERDEDPRKSSGDDAQAHAPGADLIVLGPDARRVQMLRGPPPPTPSLTWRPRSSRGPPAQVQRSL
jgi:hypothetical protein